MRALWIALLLAAGCDDALIFYGFCDRMKRIPIELRSEVPAQPGLGERPLLVRMESDDLMGQDPSTFVFFADDSCTPLAHEIDAFDPTTGELAAWVAAPPSSRFSLAFEGPAAIERRPFAGYRGVWHFDDPTNGFADSGPHGFTGTVRGGERNRGVVGHAYALDRNTQPVTFGDHDELDFTIQESFSFSAWIAQTGQTNSWQEIVNKGGNDIATPGYALEIFDEDNQSVYPCLGSGDGVSHWTCAPSPTSPKIGEDWAHAVVVIDRGSQQATLFWNGEDVLTRDVNGIDPSLGNNEPLQVSCPFFPFEGMIDELRVVGVALTPEWIRFEYDNQRPDGETMSFGEVEEAPPH